jgi:LEA14-like dessication related protein
MLLNGQLLMMIWVIRLRILRTIKKSIISCWQEIEQIQITLMQNKFGRYWEDTDGLLEVKNYALNLEVG